MNKEKVQVLKEDMEVLEIQSTKIKKAREEFELSLKDELEIKTDIEAVIAVLKAELTIEALAEFKLLGKKKLLGGIGIREGSTLSYSPEKALEYAKEKSMFLALDVKSFNKVAGSLSLEFVETGTKTTVTFPKAIKL